IGSGPTGVRTDPACSTVRIEIEGGTGFGSRTGPYAFLRIPSTPGHDVAWSHGSCLWEKVEGVAGRIGVTTTDLRQLLGVVDPARAGEPGDMLPYSLLHDIADLVPCDEISFEVIEPYRRVLAAQGDRPEPDRGVNPDLAELWWPAFWESRSYPQRSGDYTRV